MAFLLLGQATLRTQEATPPTPPPPILSDDEVMAAINRGVDFLLKDLQQKAVELRKSPTRIAGHPTSASISAS